MRTFVGIHDPRGSEHATAALAQAAGSRPEDVIRIGPLALAGVGLPERHGGVTCFLNGELHDVAEVTARLGLHPETAPGLVVACGYARGGERFLETLRGAYQLVLWDDAQREAIVTQDHLSARAVFYHDDGTRVTFASEISPLLVALPSRPAPDRQTVPRWITDRALPDGLTLYEDVRRLQMGWSLRFGRRRPELRRIWEPRYVRPEPVSASDAGDMIRAAVSRAVQRRLGDGTTGILLSGGFDSGTLAGTAAPILREHGRTLPAYSSVFPGEVWDESSGVDVLTRDLELPSTRIRVTGGSVATAVSFQNRWALPLPAPGAILDQPLLALAHQAGLRVMFDGQGGDELFAASPYLLADYAMRGRLRSAWRLAHSFPQVGVRLAPWQVRAVVKELMVKGALQHGAHEVIARARGSMYADIGWLTPASRRCAEALEDPWAWKALRGGPRWWRFLAYTVVEAREPAGLQDFLRRRAAQFGIESRQPLMVDVDLVELMLRLPPELAFSRGYDRALARDAMRGIVPEAIRVGLRKSDYSPFIHRTLAQDDFDELRRVLAPRDAEIGAYVDLELMRRELLERTHRTSDRAWGSQSQYLWALATTELWLRSHALGADFARWVEGLRLTPSRLELLTAPAGAAAWRATSTSPFFHLAPCAPSVYSVCSNNRLLRRG